MIRTITRMLSGVCFPKSRFFPSILLQVFCTRYCFKEHLEFRVVNQQTVNTSISLMWVLMWRHWKSFGIMKLYWNHLESFGIIKPFNFLPLSSCFFPLQPRIASKDVLTEVEKQIQALNEHIQSNKLVQISSTCTVSFIEKKPARGFFRRQEEVNWEKWEIPFKINISSPSSNQDKTGEDTLRNSILKIVEYVDSKRDHLPVSTSDFFPFQISFSTQEKSRFQLW